MTTPPFPVSHLTMVLFGLSAMLDTGKHDDITIADVKRHSRAGDLLKFLHDHNGVPFDMGITDHDPGFAQWYTAKIEDLCGVRERRTYAIENRGLCLLISLTAEIIQQGDDIKK
jgi:hypothetical protein